jgi:hypothetical protein
MDKNQQMIVEQARKRFHDIMKYTNLLEYVNFSSGGMVAEADDENAPQEGGEEMPPMGGPEAGGQPPMQGGDPMAGGQDMQGAPQDANAIPQDPNAMPQGAGMGQTSAAQVPGLDIQQQGGQEMGTEGAQTPDFDSFVGEDDDVVDITDLTDAQEDTEHKVDRMGAAISKTLKYLSSFEDILKANSAKIDDLNKELEKRNPTQQEKLSMRAAVSGPFTETPEEYWDKKEATSNYSLDDDENGRGMGQYAITNADLNTKDWRTISKSMDANDIYRQAFNDIKPF